MKITVAAHEVEVEADAALAEVATRAMTLFMATLDEARQAAFGFDTAGGTHAQADEYPTVVIPVVTP